MLQHLIQPSFQYSSDSQTSGSGNCHLCVEFGSYYLTVLVYDENKTVLHVEVYTLKDGVDVYTLEYILENESFKHVNFSEVHLISNTPHHSLVPDTFFKAHLSENIYKSIQGDLHDIHIEYDIVQKWELVNVYGIDKSIYQFMLQRFALTKTHHFVSLALVSIFNNYLEDLDAFMKLYFSPHFLTIILIKGAQLQFAQSVYYETTEDAIYQILNLFEKHHMDLTSVKTMVSGHIDADSSTWKELRKYILDVQLETSVIDEFNTEDNLTVASHFFTPHLHILQCV